MPDLRLLIHAERLRRGWSIGRLLRESDLPPSKHSAGYHFLSGRSNSGPSVIEPLLTVLDLLNLGAAESTFEPPPTPDSG